MRDLLRRRAAPAVLALAVTAPAGCGDGTSSAAVADDGRLDVVASPPAVLEVVERVGGEGVDATGVTPPGADAHAAELTGDRVARVVDADLAVHVRALSPSVDEAVALREGPSVDVLEVEGARAEDPHVWLDPVLLAEAADAVAAGLAEADPAGADGYERRADELVGELEALDEDLAARLAPCRGAVLVTAHQAFGYLADRYGLEQVALTGVDPHVEPTPARLRDVTEQVREAGVRTVFFDEVTSTGVAQTLADEAGVATSVLSPLEASVEPDYLTAMRANGDALARGLVCAG
ncbi:metal ABC transporter substrate-binding protein [Pseudokineococcus basanitobsidens]|uniref:Metal ABC transporter substrate-binding protein n=1 Tax=Pseudokineococcus basanitobsidens TaxID=1926649 RepID=A0ABU8RKS9_9ACTN